MKNRRKYLRTDMAAECETDDVSGRIKGIELHEDDRSGFHISRLNITDPHAEKLLGKPMGRYITISVGKIWLDSDAKWEGAVELIADELKGLILSLASDPLSVLVVGLGNRFIISDAIGPLSVKGLTVNRHIKESDPSIFEKLGSMPISAIAPGVTGQTGIEALELVKGATDAVKPSVIIVIDALAAKDVGRLGTTVQLSDTGISPGSGIGNRRKAISKETLGIPVISVGIPTVVDSSTLVFGMLEKAGVEELSPSLEAELENGRSFFVTLKDADTVITEMSKLISQALHSTFSLDE